MDNATCSWKSAAAHARADAFAKLRELYRRRVMGSCLRNRGAYKLLLEQERRKKRYESKKDKLKEERGRGWKGEEEKERARARGGNFSIPSQDIQGYSSELREERDLQFRGKNTSGYLRDKVPHRTKRLRASRRTPFSVRFPSPLSFIRSTHNPSRRSSSPRKRPEEEKEKKKERKEGRRFI